jgi:hypothetical protein
MESRLQERQVDLTAQRLFITSEKERGPGMDRRVHIAKVPLVGRDLTVGMEIEPGEHEVELLLGEVGVDGRQRDGVKRQIPSGIPGVLPLVGHGDDIVIDHMKPVTVPEGTARRMEGVGVVLLQPGVSVQVVILLAPEHAGEGLAHDIGCIRRHRGGRHVPIKLIRLPQACLEHDVERLERIGRRRRRARQAQPDHLCTPCLDV